MIQLFRVLLPSWKFFDGVVDASELWYRSMSPSEGEWTLCIPKTGKRSWARLFINSHENYLFAAHALLEHLRDDLRDGVDPALTLALVKNLVEYQIRASGKSLDSYQFMMSKSVTDQPDYLSPIMEMQS